MQGGIDPEVKHLSEALGQELKDADRLDFEIRTLQWLRTLFQQAPFERGTLCREVPADCPKAYQRIHSAAVAWAET